MLVRRRRGWELPEREATPEAMFLGRRELIKAAAAGSMLLPGVFSSFAAAAEEDPSAGLYPAKQNPRYTLDRPLTDEKLATTYNNFYEFGSQKFIADEAQALKIRPWTIKIDGLVEKETTVGIDDLLKSGYIAIVVSRPGRWQCRGAAFRWPPLSISPSHSARRNICRW